MEEFLAALSTMVEGFVALLQAIIDLFIAAV